MSEADEALRAVVTLAVQLLPQQQHPTADQLDKVLAVALEMAPRLGHDGVDRDEARRWLESRVSVTQDDSVGMVSDKDHLEWLRAAKEQREWPFWERYERYLLNVKGRSIPVVNTLGRSTDAVFGELEDPLRPGKWQRRGLVLGQVQSGKTGHFVGLAAKAADAGYRLIIVLAGMLDDLRAQTQARLDEDLLGFDTQYQLRSAESRSTIGVGTLVGSKRLPIASLTTSAQSGDFKKSAASRANIPIGESPVILVIKKHPRIIDYVRTWMTEVNGTEDPETGERIVKGVPLFLIDDEADNASINLNDTGEDPSKINGAIRNLLAAFERSSYVGYTATPFANIYIDPDADHAKFGADLFPASFIHSLRAPSNYLGPERLFGLSSSSEDDEDEVKPLPLVRHVDDAQSWVPPKHRSTFTITEGMPSSLETAINGFVLVCAARRARGQVAVHNSMLVHVTRFTNVQQQVSDQVDEYLYVLRQELAERFGGRVAVREAELQALWEKDFESTTGQFPADEAQRLPWHEVRDHILPALKRIHVKQVNGAAKDVLDYYENRADGLSVIAVGGQKLSRGLTLEGLSVSYYLRFSNTYDTLLQMGRWFGYRPGYEDLCRLWMTPQLEAAYREITRATDELRRDIEEMSVLGMTPENYGLKVQTSSMGLSVTAANKSRQGTRVRVSYQGELAETTIFPLRGGVPRSNFESLEAFVKELDGAHIADSNTTAGVTWRGVSAEEVAAGFFDRYRTAREATRVKPDLIAKYIRSRAARGELGDWTVRLVSQQNGTDPIDIVTRQVAVVTRRRLEDDPLTKDSTRKTIKRILSPAHEAIDLTERQRELALEFTKKAAEGKVGRNGQPLDPKIPTGAPLRQRRNPDQALLLIYPIDRPEGIGLDDVPFLVGFAASFPRSSYDEGVEYMVNSTWLDDDDDLFDQEEPEA
ncbi:Z1 domain-containing protein [Nocardioides panzhihuensis]|uniref:Putative endonuclease Z1 domain-containing protein n=1 Tax=Nocardioides panzhihuensis TaxID=860243 RepID=A0A7Z0IVR7_9ACTN|nr:Z1 domain-containing protein [Nocardioides panzhihuensis]NYI81048.1 hypothetical protein [Nocardioides panzhihuensis]